MSDPLSHFDEKGAATMVEVGAKPPTARMAKAACRVRMATQTFERIVAGQVGKGDVLGVARLAAIMAAKSTAQVIPLCHPVQLTSVEVDFELSEQRDAVTCLVVVHAVDRTGPEMEAMHAASVAGLTIYDMCKAMDRGMTLEAVSLLEKSGGKSGHWTR